MAGSFDQYTTVEIDELKGHGFSRIDVADDTLTFYGMQGQPLFQMCHDQDCCEHVYLEDVVGDLDDLIGTPIFLAEESSSRIRPRDKLNEDDADYWQVPDSETWTFYKFATMKGSVTLRWYGTSNGYYSERVSIHAWRDEIE